MRRSPRRSEQAGDQPVSNIVTATFSCPLPLDHWIFGAICDLPEKEGRVILKALHEGLPLNRRLRKLLLAAEEAAEYSAGCSAAAEAEAQEW